MGIQLDDQSTPPLCALERAFDSRIPARPWRRLLLSLTRQYCVFSRVPKRVTNGIRASAVNRALLEAADDDEDGLWDDFDDVDDAASDDSNGGGGSGVAAAATRADDPPNFSRMDLSLPAAVLARRFPRFPVSVAAVSRAACGHLGLLLYNLGVAQLCDSCDMSLSTPRL